VPGKDRHREARPVIAATSRSVQKSPAVRRERSALTSHAYNSIMICKKRTAAMLADAAVERSGRLSKGHLKYPHTYTLLDQVRLVHCLTKYDLATWHRLPARPALQRLPLSLRINGVLLNNFRLIWVIQPPAQKYSASHPPQISGFFRASRLDTIAQGMPECFGCTCMLVCVSLCALCTRDRGCSVHPAFPAPSVLRDKVQTKSRAQCAARTRMRV
jgi:hypothetical protein